MTHLKNQKQNNMEDIKIFSFDAVYIEDNQKEIHKWLKENRGNVSPTVLQTQSSGTGYTRITITFFLNK